MKEVNENNILFKGVEYKIDQMSTQEIDELMSELKAEEKKLNNKVIEELKK